MAFTDACPRDVVGTEPACRTILSWDRRRAADRDHHHMLVKYAVGFRRRRKPFLAPGFHQEVFFSGSRIEFVTEYCLAFSQGE